MNREVEIACLWMKANKITTNAAKSSGLAITPGAKTTTQKTKIVCDGLPIAVNSTVKYGLTKTLNLTSISNLLSVKSPALWVYSIN